MLVTLLPIVDVGQASAEFERIAPDAGDAVGDRDAAQAGAVSERIASDASDAVGDRVGSGFAPRTLDKRVRALVEQDPIHTAIEGVERIHRYRAQAGAVIERITPMLVTLLGIVTLLRLVQL